MNKLAFIIMFLLLPLSSSSGHIQNNQSESLSLDKILIAGSVKDNYANISLSFEISNPTDNTDEYIFGFATSSSLFLSNFSLQLTKLTYWGQVKPIETAQQEYQNATASNQTAVLVEKIGSVYQTSFNLQSQETGTLIFYFEGYIKRSQGQYEFNLLDLSSFSDSALVNMEIDLTLGSSTLQLRSARLFGLNGVSVSQLSSKSYRLTLNETVTVNDIINLRYRYFSDGIQTQLLTYSNGTTNFFLYSFAPEIYDIHDIVDREYIFVLDTSGSMGGTKITNAKIAFNSLLETLVDDDLFNIVAFASAANIYKSESVIGSSSNILDAQSWVNSLTASGSTDIEAGLTTALDLFSTSSITAKVVVFLSDGQPTLGLGSQDGELPQLAEYISDSNVEEATIYSIALGSQTAEGLMATIAFESGGDFAIIQSETTLDNDLGLLYENFRYPVATGLSIEYTGTQGPTYPNMDIVSKNIFNGSEVIQTGMFGSSLDIETTLILGSGPQIFTATASSTNDSLNHIEKLWAINQINALLQLNVLSHKSEITAQIVQLAVYYQLVVDGYTALVLVVDTDDGNDIDPNADTDYDPYQDRDANEPDNQADNPPVSQVISTVGVVASFRWLSVFVMLIPLIVFYKKKGPY